MTVTDTSTDDDDQPCLCGHEYEAHARDDHGCLPCTACGCDDFWPSVEAEFRKVTT